MQQPKNFRNEFGVTKAVFLAISEISGIEEKKLKILLHFFRHYPTIRSGASYWRISPQTYQDCISFAVSSLFFCVRDQVNIFFKKGEKKERNEEKKRI
jgi:hypothetical protein